MQNAQEILGYTTIAVAIVEIVASALKGLTAIEDSYSDSKRHVYHFDRSKLPLASSLVIATITVTFCYGYLIGREFGLALQFCGLTSFFVVLAIIFGFTDVSIRNG
jgi:hypothetical protein